MGRIEADTLVDTGDPRRHQYHSAEKLAELHLLFRSATSSFLWITILGALGGMTRAFAPATFAEPEGGEGTGQRLGCGPGCDTRLASRVQVQIAERDL